MYYKYINRNRLEPAPTPLEEIKIVNGEEVKNIIFTLDESIYNRFGYYRCEAEEYPDDTEYEYTVYYEEATPSRLYHLKRWERGEKKENSPEAIDIKQAFNIVVKNIEDATTIKGIREGLIAAANEIGEVNE